MTDASTNERLPLERGRIVAAAVARADAEGVAKLSMRLLARDLGFEVMSLYNHIANKADLLAAMVDSVAEDIIDPDPALPPLARVRALVISAREALVAHPWATAQWQASLPGEGRIRLTENLLAAFADSGLPGEVAHHGYHAVFNHVLGYTLQAQSMDLGGEEDAAVTIRTFLDRLDPDRHANTIAHVHQHLAGDTGSSFELVLDLILDGLTRLPADPSGAIDAADRTNREC